MTQPAAVAATRHWSHAQSHLLREWRHWSRRRTSKIKKILKLLTKSHQRGSLPSSHKKLLLLKKRKELLHWTQKYQLLFSNLKINFKKQAKLWLKLRKVLTSQRSWTSILMSSTMVNSSVEKSWAQLFSWQTSAKKTKLLPWVFPRKNSMIAILSSDSTIEMNFHLNTLMAKKLQTLNSITIVGSLRIQCQKSCRNKLLWR